ncbi:MAG: asparagine synthase (glutamine-hydrolyzing) [Methylocystis sp.]
MCGINGVFAYDGVADPVDRKELLTTRDQMTERGPDGAGLWISDDQRVGLGHRRLAIVDLTEKGAQPMRTKDGRLTVTFNGEIYNYRDLRSELEAKGYVFHSRSDTEALLHLYADRGADMVHALRGMFAFAIWDEAKRELLLARDPYGVKPVYYADDHRTFRFASQVKALVAGGAIARDLDPAGQVGFLLWGSVPEPFTTYRSIRMLPAGCHLVVKPTGVGAPRRYHSIGEAYCEAQARQRAPGFRNHAAHDELAQKTRDALLDSVRSHLVADVPVGAFLSAGIDSGALLGLMRDSSQAAIKTVTITFDAFRGGVEDEAPLAAETARTYGAEHFTRRVTDQELRADLSNILAAMDQPSIDGVNTWFASKAALELGLKVVVSGLGGDELFGGYPSFRDIPRWVAWLRAPARLPKLGKLVRLLLIASGLDKRLPSPKAAGIFELGGSFAGAYMLRRGLFMPWELDRLIDRDILREGLATLRPLERVKDAMPPSPTTAFATVATLESSLYMRNQLLRDTDWASMAHGLEVRVPLVDATLLERIVALGEPPMSGAPKSLLAQSPRRPLPEAALRRSKIGFVAPTPSWTAADSQEKSRSASSVERSRKGSESRSWAQRLLADAVA